MTRLGVQIISAAVLCIALSGPTVADMLGGLKNQAAERLLGGSVATTTGGGALGLGDLSSSLGLHSLGGEATSNMAGILQYCVKNKYLSMTNTDQVKDQLLDKLGLGDQAEQQKDPGYQQGVAGILSGKDGSTFDLSNVKGDLKDKACDYVLENASSLL